MSENGSKKGRILKLLVEIELKNPLMRGTNVKLDEEMAWVDLSYEQLPAYCFYCGRIGHQERSCSRKIADSQNNSVKEGQYGECLRVKNFQKGEKGRSSGGWGEVKKLRGTCSNTR